MFGVSYANLYKFQKQIKIDHGLAQRLWETDNHDARILATLVADPKAMTDKQAEEWAKGMGNYVIVEMLSKLLIKSPLARKKAEKWHKSKDEWFASAGQKNRVRHEMNGALIAIGLRNGGMEKKATEVAKKIGKVVVNHGETNCKTPDAIEYIEKTKAYRDKKKAKAAAK